MSLVQPWYLVFVGAGVLMALAFPVARHIADARLKRQYYLLQVITLVGAVVGAKVSVLFGDQHWPWVPITDWQSVFTSGRSITGALLGGFLCAELAKPLIGYPLPPNDRFAALLPFSLAIGRCGCLVAGCCGGLPTDGWCAWRDAAGVARYPTQIFEIIFQLLTGITFVVMVRRGLLFGRLFSFYLVVYGTFRFGTEFLRATPKFFGPLSGYQLLALTMIVLGGAFLWQRTRATPAGWEQFRLPARSGQPN